MTDQELLKRYAAGEQEAFVELVRRHVNMVYGTARRRTPEDAEDVTQAVFLLLAQRNGRLRRHVSLAGWLHRAADLCGRNAEKIARRRIFHEHQAARKRIADMAERTSISTAEAMLDGAMETLGAVYREVIVLRYLEKRSVEETADALGVSREAVVKRTSRGVEKLRRYYAQTGFTAEALGAALTARLTDAAPAGLAEKATAATASGAKVAGMAASTAKSLAIGTQIKVVLAAAVLVVAAAVNWIVLSSRTAEQAPAPANTAAASEPAAIQPEWMTKPLIQVGTEIRPPSDKIVAEILAGIETNRKKLHTLEIEAKSTYKEWDAGTSEWNDAGDTEGRAWVDRTGPRKMRLEITKQRTVWTGGAQPFNEESFAETWDGHELRRLYQPPYSGVRGDIATRQLNIEGRGILGEEFSMQLLVNIGEGENNVEFIEDPLAPATLQHMKLAGREVTLNGKKAEELTVRFGPMAKIPGIEHHFNRYWFDPDRGYAFVGHTEGRDGDLPYIEYATDETAEAAPGVFYPTRGHELWRELERGKVTGYMRFEFIASRVVANQPIPAEQFHLNFPPGVNVSQQGPAGSQPATQK